MEVLLSHSWLLFHFGMQHSPLLSVGMRGVDLMDNMQSSLQCVEGLKECENLEFMGPRMH